MKNKLLWMLLALLGFAPSCIDSENDDPDPYICEYGTPSASFSVKGKVTDDEQVPIPGIQVKLGEDYLGSEEVFTDENGEFAFVKAFAHSIPKTPVPLIFTDVDGEENGLFDSVSVDVQFEQNPDVNHNSWYQGDFIADDVEVRMPAAKAESEEE